MTTPLDLIQAILSGLRLKRERDAAIALLHSLDRRTLQDIGLDHYGISSIPFEGGSDLDRSDAGDECRRKSQARSRVFWRGRGHGTKPVV